MGRPEKLEEWSLWDLELKQGWPCWRDQKDPLGFASQSKSGDDGDEKLEWSVDMELNEDVG